MEGPDQIFDAASFVTSAIDGKVKLRLDESTAEYPPMSLPSLLIEAAEKSPNQVALSVKRDSDWVKWTYSDYLKGRKTILSVCNRFITRGAIKMGKIESWHYRNYNFVALRC